MARVKLFNLSDKVQVLLRKTRNEDDNYAFQLEIIIDADDMEIAGKIVFGGYEDWKEMHDVFDNKATEEFAKKHANNMINNVLGDEFKEYLIQ